MKRKITTAITVIFVCLTCAGSSVGDEGVQASDMVLVPEGEFSMGCNRAVDKRCNADEQPYHKVYLEPFYIDKTEVTVDRYALCVVVEKCEEPASRTKNKFCNWHYEKRGNHPVNCVTWRQARAYCAYAGKRLPTEAQWEKAARGADGRIYPWGNQDATCGYAVMSGGSNGCGRKSTWVVGSKSSGTSPYDAMDMAGNVSEWASDWYDEKSYLRKDARFNPKGPATGEERVIRGGSWYNTLESLRASNRSTFAPDRYDPSIGFRCVSTPR